ncbi:MAG: PhoX family phosphatase [Gammaproteobacteria bacterium]|nr:PhoX family phosphatase [Gammaproteobacteria bacterium]MCP5136757.1 PhoX family phosphatase [Gammaproteobacteria bacterium]
MSTSSHRPDRDSMSSRSEYFEALEDVALNPSLEPTLGDVIQRRFRRRDVLKGALGAVALGALAGTSLRAFADPLESGEKRSESRFGFTEISHGVDETHHVAPGYRADVLIRWGDPVTADAPEFDPYRQSAASQLKQFGYNNDFVGYVPLPFGSANADHGLLCINHEYTDEEVMFPGFGRHVDGFDTATRALTDIEMACNGGSIIEIRKTDGRWGVVANSRYARRITALDTEMALSGPAAGHPRLQTHADPSGRRVIGTFNNCAGGITPWGTYLMAEENFNNYFLGELSEPAEAENYARLGLPGHGFPWGKFHKRFDVGEEPNEPNRFGWVVEVDPFDPVSIPVKRTALGRFKHEGAEGILNGDGRYVIYCGDDQRFEFLYRFVSDAQVNKRDRGANRDLLDHGTLSVARLADDGTLAWLPLVHGQGPLTAENGFASQADVLIETRRAATLLGATPMDRPEDVEPNPVNGRVYVMLTNNSKRDTDQVDGANPRARNIWGHILELIPEKGDHAAATARWEVLLRGGNPKDPGTHALWNPATSEQGWFACPDNCAVDPQGRLWVSTDQGRAWKAASGTADGVWAVETEGAKRGTGRMFFRVPVGAEMCGPRFTPDGRTLFVAVQHPATDGTLDYPGFERRSTFEDPATRWPDFDPNMPPRPSVVVITKDDGGPIGG